jgi:hypothetical protein
VRLRFVCLYFFACLLGDSLFDNVWTGFDRGLFGTTVGQPELLVHSVRHRPKYKYSYI